MLPLDELHLIQILIEVMDSGFNAFLSTSNKLLLICRICGTCFSTNSCQIRKIVSWNRILNSQNFQVATKHKNSIPLKIIMPFTKWIPTSTTAANSIRSNKLDCGLSKISSNFAQVDGEKSAWRKYKSISKLFHLLHHFRSTPPPSCLPDGIALPVCCFHTALALKLWENREFQRVKKWCKCGVLNLSPTISRVCWDRQLSRYA